MYSRQTNIGDQEVADVPSSTHKDRESVEDQQDGEESERTPGQVWLEWASEPLVLVCQTLNSLGLMETDERETDGDPSEQTGNGGKIGKLPDQLCLSEFRRNSYPKEYG